MSQEGGSSIIRKEESQLSQAECTALQTILTNKTRSTEMLLELLGRFPIVGKIRYEKSKLREIIAMAEVVYCEPDEPIYQRNGKERCFYLLLRGSVAAWGHQHAGLRGTEEQLIRQIRAGNYFGHTLELDNMEISMIRAIDSCCLLRLDLRTMYKVFEGAIVFPETTQKYNFYRKLLLFKDLDKKRILKMVEATEKRIFLIDSVVYAEGTTPSHLFVVVTGQVELLKRRGGHEIPVATVTTYELLGIEDILAGRPYSFTARAKDQSVMLIQIPKEVVLDVLDQVHVETSVFEMKSKLRETRISSAVVNKIPSKRQSLGSEGVRASFREKQRFYTEEQPVAPHAVENPLERLRRTSYLTNKREKFFQNEEEFYRDKIRQCETIIKTRYGESFGGKFYNLFEDYPIAGRKRKLRSRVHTAQPPIAISRAGTTLQRRSRQSNRTSSGWHFRAPSINQTYQSAELPPKNMTQLRRKLLDVEDTEKRLTEHFGLM